MGHCNLLVYPNLCVLEANLLPWLSRTRASQCCSLACALRGQHMTRLTANKPVGAVMSHVGAAPKCTD